MPDVHFTSNLKRHIDCPPATVAGTNVRQALDEVFANNPRLQGYLLDDQRALRQHVMVYVDGKPIVDRADLSDAVGEDSEIYVMQALSGG